MKQMFSLSLLWAIAVSGLSLCGLVVAPGCQREADVPEWRQAECGSCEVGVLDLCLDGDDNDGDGLVDCDDPDCAVVAVCLEPAGAEESSPAACSNGVDDDGDGFVDCNDFSCQPTTACTPEIKEPESTALRCSDGLDNDGDGLFDCKDSDCYGFGTVCEATNAACADGLDNDNNGFTDCQDFGCTKNPSVTACH